MKLKVLIWLGILLLLGACVPERDPRNIADAYATHEEADRLNAASEYSLTQQKIVDTIDNTEKQTRLDIFVSVKDELMGAAKWSVIFLTIVFIPTAGIYIWRAGQTAAVVTERVGYALALKAETRAALIFMDGKTRTFPIQPYVIDGSVFMINYNTGEKFLVNGADKAPNAQMISALAQVATSGALADEARRDRKNSGNASHYAEIDPRLIEVS